MKKVACLIVLLITMTGCELLDMFNNCIHPYCTPLHDYSEVIDVPADGGDVEFRFNSNAITIILEVNNNYIWGMCGIEFPEYLSVEKKQNGDEYTFVISVAKNESSDNREITVVFQADQLMGMRPEDRYTYTIRQACTSSTIK